MALPARRWRLGHDHGHGYYKVSFAATLTGQVAVFGALSEADATSAFSLRLKVLDRKSVKRNCWCVRIRDFGRAGRWPEPLRNPRFDDKPILQQNLKAGEGRPRERLIAIADGYFDSLQLNDGQLSPSSIRTAPASRTVCSPPTSRQAAGAHLRDGLCRTVQARRLSL